MGSFDPRANLVPNSEIAEPPRGCCPFHSNLCHTGSRRTDLQLFEKCFDMTSRSFHFQLNPPVVPIAHRSAKISLSCDSPRECAVAYALHSSRHVNHGPYYCRTGLIGHGTQEVDAEIFEPTARTKE